MKNASVVVARAVLLLGVAAVTVQPLASSPPCDHYGGPRCNYPFLPAPPGRTPPCGKAGGTFCEKIEHYPMQLIRYLIEKWGYDYNTLLSDESRDEFQDRTPKPLPPPPSYHYPAPHSYSKVVPVYYPQTHLQAPMNYSSAPVSSGYPDRRYRFGTSSPASTPYYSGPYLSTLLPGHYTPSETWWTRYSREAEKQRQKRQAASPAPGNGASQLCPVTSSFVMPRAAVNNRGNWMYVVNLNEVDDRYTQLVRSETCASSQCNGLCSIPNGYSSSCQQQYVQKRLVALEGSGDRLYTDVFWFPHCCICQIVPNSG